MIHHATVNKAEADSLKGFTRNPNEDPGSETSQTRLQIPQKATERVAIAEESTPLISGYIRGVVWGTSWSVKNARRCQDRPPLYGAQRSQNDARLRYWGLRPCKTDSAHAFYGLRLELKGSKSQDK